MSRVERFPYNELADAMVYPPYFPPTAMGTFDSVLEKPYAHYQEAKKVELPFTDPLHRSMAQPLHYKGDLPDFFAPQVGTPGAAPVSPVETILRARVLREFPTQFEFQSAYLAGNTLYLTDCVKILDGDLSLPPGTMYKGQGMVLLQKGKITSSGIVPKDPAPGELPSVLTLATLEGDIVFLGGAPHVGCFVAPKGSVSVAGTGTAQVVGSVAAARLPASGFPEGLSIQYPSNIDPTRMEDPTAPRYFDYYLLAVGSVPVSVERLP
jgi:hypothetical protein